MRTKKKKKRLWIELTSLTDVVFLLLIFFMLSTTFVHTNKNLDIKLPHARGISEQNSENTVIEISNDGEIAFNGQIISSYEELEKNLDNLAVTSPNEIIIIRADQDINYGNVVKIMGLCKSKNFNRLGMAALQEKE